MTTPIPPQPANSFRIVITLGARANRMDNVLLQALKDQKDDLNLRNISRSALKALFTSGRVQIKGQRAKPSSALAAGVTYVDILNPG